MHIAESLCCVPSKQKSVNPCVRVVVADKYINTQSYLFIDAKSDINPPFASINPPILTSVFEIRIFIEVSNSILATG